MFIIKYILLSLLFNNTYTIDKIYEGKIFYNFVLYEDELYVSSNNGIYKIDSSNKNSLLIFDKNLFCLWVRKTKNRDFNRYKATIQKRNA